MLRSSCACSSVRSLDRPTLESNSGAAASTASTSPSSKDAISASSIWSTASSRRPEVAAKRSATCFERAIGNRLGCCRTRVHAAARRRCGGSQCTGSAAEASSRRRARATARIAAEVACGRSLVEPTPIRVSDCEGSMGGTRPAAASVSLSSMWPSTSEVSSSVCWPAARPPSARGCPEPGAGMPSFSSTASVSSIPFSSSVRSLVSARCEKPALSKSARVKEALRTPWAARSDGDGCKTMSVTVSPPVRRCARSVSPE
mmetsp:Transcript_15873/g.48181  ORF Transcript_15873/g.48181 Transcript_15873/m.48181 type:complete len:259 (-) Transcript_15873:659-1435(-)